MKSSTRLNEVEESVTSLVWDYLDTMLPNELSNVVESESLQEYRRSFANELESEVREKATSLYMSVRDEAEDVESVSELRSVIKREMDEEHGGQF